jgi:outer membrane immunogenic protein
MKKILLAAVALTVLAAPAMAADLAVKAPAYKALPPVYAYNWTGCYVGGNVGGLWAHKDWTAVGLDHFESLGSLGGHDADGWLGGIQGGCDYQFAGGFVIGIAADYDWTDANGSNASLINTHYGPVTNHSGIESLASVTGRVGYAWDRALGYVKGGGAWERGKYFIDGDQYSPAVTPASTRSGWTVGIGGEYAFNNWLSAFAEYDYYNFGTQTHAFTWTCSCVDFVGIKETASVFKVGLNLRFGGLGGPVAARY